MACSATTMILMKDIDVNAFVNMKARLWDYSASHDRLSIELSGDGDRLFLVFYFCERINLPWSWFFVSPRIVREDCQKKYIFTDGGDPDEIKIIFFDAVVLSVEEHQETYHC